MGRGSRKIEKHSKSPIIQIFEPCMVLQGLQRVASEQGDRFKIDTTTGCKGLYQPKVLTPDIRKQIGPWPDHHSSGSFVVAPEISDDSLAQTDLSSRNRSVRSSNR